MKYRKKSVVIEAIQWTGMNDAEIEDFVGDALVGYKLVIHYSKSAQYNSKHIYIKTLEGTMTASVQDYIIRGVNGEFYPCKPDVFEKTYEPEEESNEIHN